MKPRDDWGKSILYVSDSLCGAADGKVDTVDFIWFIGMLQILHWASKNRFVVPTFGVQVEILCFVRNTVNKISREEHQIDRKRKIHVCEDRVSSQEND